MGAALVAFGLGAGGVGIAAGTAIDVAAVAAGAAYSLGLIPGLEDVNEAPPHAPPVDDEAFPLPQYLQDASYISTVNVGIFGASGSGKSTLVNTIRGIRPIEPHAAPVGANETTMEPTMYLFGDGTSVRLWDIPGAGTERFPRDTYIRDMGLRFFDAVVLVTSTRVTDIDRSIVAVLQGYRVPCFVVRSKIDVDIRNELEDNGLSDETTRVRVHEEMLHSLGGVADTFLVSKCSDEPETQRLRNSILACVTVNRRKREEDQDDCPVCFYPFGLVGEKQPVNCHRCNNPVCRSCVDQMTNRITGALNCPFCRSSFSDGGESSY